MSNQSQYAPVSITQFVKDNKVIQTPGTYKVRVKRVGPEIPSQSMINQDGTARIATLAVVLKQDIEENKQVFEDGFAKVEDLRLANYNYESNNSNWGQFPMKNEEVYIQVEEYTTKENGRSRHAGETILVVSDITLNRTVATGTSTESVFGDLVPENETADKKVKEANSVFEEETP